MAGSKCDLAERIGAELIVRALPGKQSDGRKTKNPNDYFEQDGPTSRHSEVFL